MATPRRQQRVNDAIQRELSALLRFELEDPRLKEVVVTAVEVTPDLRTARVFVGAYGSDDRRAAILSGLAHALPYFRREVGRRVQLRAVPLLDFRWDDSLREGEKIERLLDEAMRSDD